MRLGKRHDGSSVLWKAGICALMFVVGGSGCGLGQSEGNPVVAVDDGGGSSGPDATSGPDGSEDDDINNTGCKEDYPVSQGPTEPCCPEWGRDACGANLFCAAFDGRTQPTCYSENSRMGGESCKADSHCSSQDCNTEAGKCRYVEGRECDPEVGCADGSACAADQTDTVRCRPLGDGEPGAFCTESSHCDGTTVCYRQECTEGSCRPPAQGCQSGQRCIENEEGELECIAESEAPGAACDNDSDCADHLRCLGGQFCVETCSRDSECGAGMACDEQASICVDSQWIDACKTAMANLSACCESEIPPDRRINYCLGSYRQVPAASACDRQEMECINATYEACGSQPPSCQLSSECKAVQLTPNSKAAPCPQ